MVKTIARSDDARSPASPDPTGGGGCRSGRTSPDRARPGAVRLLRGALAAAVLALAALAQPPAAPAQGDESPLYLTDARVVDVEAGEARSGLTVVVRDGRIRRIAPAGEVGSPPDDARTLSLDGRYVLPGLIDAHTHLGTLAAARRALESGVTTARTVGVGGYRDVAMRQMVREGLLAGPDLTAGGVFVTPGLGDAVLADSRLTEFHGREVRSPEDLRRVVAVNADRGVDWIKTRATKRAGLPEQDPRQQVYTESQLRAVVEEGDEHGIPVAVHGHGDAGVRAAVRAGARSIEHGTYASAETLRLMAERGTYLVPTVAVVEDLTRPGGDYSGPHLEVRGRHMLPRIRRTAARARELGVPVIAGVDTGYGPESVLRIGHELEELVGVGLSEQEALRAATSRAAEMLGVDDRTGRIEEGLEADLVVVDRNPLEDIGYVQDVLAVVSDGRLAVNRLPFARE